MIIDITFKDNRKAHFETNFFLITTNEMWIKTIYGELNYRIDTIRILEIRND